MKICEDEVKPHPDIEANMYLVPVPPDSGFVNVQLCCVPAPIAILVGIWLSENDLPLTMSTFPLVPLGMPLVLKVTYIARLNVITIEELCSANDAVIFTGPLALQDET